MKILILGASGMLGSALMHVFAREPSEDIIYGAARSSSTYQYFPDIPKSSFITGLNIENSDALIELFDRINPDIVINCIGLIKHLESANDPLVALPINAMFPHRLARLCAVSKARLIHISTDCVFSGTKGNYTESDVSDADDLYGKSKYIGEIAYPNSITLRTSIIGHELNSANGLIGWFLKQENQIKGFTKAIFSGLPTDELARVIRDVVIPRPNLSGLYHVSADPISKYDLLKLTAKTYEKHIEIVPDGTLVLDRSLNGDNFRNTTGYITPNWPELIKNMHNFKEGYRCVY